MNQNSKYKGSEQKTIKLFQLSQSNQKNTEQEQQHKCKNEETLETNKQTNLIHPPPLILRSIINLKTNANADS